MSGHHTQFLDLTNGKGGEGHPPNSFEEEGAASGGGLLDRGAGSSSSSTPPAAQHPRARAVSATTASDAMGAATSAAASSSSGGKKGKVVEPGREHTGRWTKEEHEAFLEALQMYGKEWKKVAARVKTRTVVQTRTHAQKYFQKLAKTMERTGKDDIMHVDDMGISTASTSEYGRKTSPRKKPRPTPSIASTSKPTRRSSSTTISAAQVISNLSNPSASSYVATGSSTTMSLPTSARHGFSTDSTSDSGFQIPYGKPSTASSWLGPSSASSMKIVAPDPSVSLRTSGFPEPSPAATGKRKLAEIAAARMLAGVAGVEAATVASAASVSDGPPTPPPSIDSRAGGAAAGRLNLKDLPAPPLFGEMDSSTSPERKGLSLQIVNPELLGVTYQERNKRRGDGEASPVTPWDGQLEALVSEKGLGEGKKAAPSGASTPSSSVVLDSRTSGATHFAVCESGSCFGRSPLHKAVSEADLETVRQLLEIVANRSVGVLQKLDDAGYSPIHTACALRLAHPPESVVPTNELVEMLLSAGADPAQLDGSGNTPLHWAARAGDKDVAVKLLLKNCPLDGENHARESPLHWAMRVGRRGMDVASVLLENGARPGVLNKEHRRPIDVAADGFLDEPGTLASIRLREEQGKKVGKNEFKKALKDSAGDRRDARANLLIRSAYSRTLVLHHPECLEHHPKSATDWEAPDRVNTIMRKVLPSSDSTGTTETSGVFPHEITVSQEFDRAKLDLLSRVHSTEYLSFVNDLSKDLEKQHKEASAAPADEFTQISGSPPPVVPFTPLVQRSMINFDEANLKEGSASDTSFSAGSLRAARRAAGAVQHAVDCVLVGRNRNAFCVVRPPGHHAGINGLLEGGESCGFCIFNNVAAGALYAISDDRLLCNKCAIVDIDVHHGNGTEEIVRNCHDPSKLFFFSIHLYDNDKRKRGNNQYQYKFYPGTGNEDDLALNIINVPIVPLWKEAAQPQPSLTTKTHNTRQKSRSSQESQDESSETEAQRLNSRASDGGSEAGSTTTSITSPRHTSSSASSGRLAYRQAIQSRLLPALRAFNPDLIIISAGFDAAKGDVGNARHERERERMGLDLEPEDYAWTTRKILEIADICCQGRVVSVLEGGYGRTPAVGQILPGNDGLDRAGFAECAVRHLQALIDPYDTERRFSS